MTERTNHHITPPALVSNESANKTFNYTLLTDARLMSQEFGKIRALQIYSPDVSTSTGE